MKALFICALLYATLVVVSRADAQTNTIILCEAQVKGQQLSRVIKLDYAKKTVNDFSAIFGEVEITWTTAYVDQFTNRIAYLDHHLNRVSSTYYSDSRGGIGIPIGPPTSYKCRKAPALAF